MPNSCCTELSDDGVCSRITDIRMGDDRSSASCQKLRKGETVCDIIYAQGCLKILKTVYQRELQTQLLIFCLFDVFVVLVEIVSCALAAAYVAQISRREKAFYWNEPGSGWLDKNLTTKHV